MKKLIALLTLCALTANATQTITNVFLGFNPPDDGTGDPAYTAFTKINENFLLCTNLIDVQSNYFQGLFDDLPAVGNYVESDSGVATNLTLWGTIISKSLTPSTAIYINALGLLNSSATTATELGRVSGVTNFIQDQINDLKAQIENVSQSSNGVYVAVSGPNLSASTNTGLVTLSTDAGTLATNHVTATSNALYQAKAEATNTLASALTGNLNTASNTLLQATLDSTNGLPRGVTASGSATATTNASGVVNIEVTGTGGDVTTAQLVAATNHALTLSTNFTFQIGQAATNNDLLFGQSSTNNTYQKALDGTNEVTRAIAAAGANWTNNELLIGGNATNHIALSSNSLHSAINAKMYSPGTQPPNYVWVSPYNAYGTLVPRLLVGADMPDYLTNWVTQAPGYLPSYATKPLTDFQEALADGYSEHQALLWHSGSPGAYYPHAIPLSIDGLTGAVTLNGHVATNLQSANWLSGSHDAFTVWDYAAAGGSRALVVYSGADPGEILIANYQGIKMPEVTASRALSLDANNYVVGSTTTSYELGYVHGVTSAIQTQLDNRIKGVIASTGLSGSTNNGVVTLSATSSSGTLLESSTVDFPTDGTVTTVHTITGIPEGCAFTVTGIISVYATNSGSVYCAGGDMIGRGVKTGGTITMSFGETLSGIDNDLTSGGYANSSGNLKISASWNSSHGTARAKWSGYIVIAQ